MFVIRVLVGRFIVNNIEEELPFFFPLLCVCCDGLFFFIPIVIDSLVVISYLTFNSINIDDEGRKKRKEGRRMGFFYS